MIRILLSLILISCASPPQKVFFPAGAVINVKEFSSTKEARNFVKNKWNYLTLLFEQSFDPYYGTPKWSPECLKKNELSPVRDSAGNLFFDSQLFLNEEHEAGFCQGALREVIYLQCKDESRVYEIVCALGSCRQRLSQNPCPLKK